MPLQKARPVPLSFRAPHFAQSNCFATQPSFYHHQQPDPVTLTPTESLDGDHEFSFNIGGEEAAASDKSDELPSHHIETQQIACAIQSPSVQSPSDNGDDMMLDSPLPTHSFKRPSLSRLHLAPPAAVHEAVSIKEGRVATPIYDHFLSVPRKSTWRSAQIDTMFEESPATTPATAFPPVMFEDDQQSMWWQRRRLPSPDSEGDDDLVSPRDPSGGLMAMLMVDNRNDHLSQDAPRP